MSHSCPLSKASVPWALTPFHRPNLPCIFFSTSSFKPLPLFFFLPGSVESMDSNCSASNSEGFWTCTESLGFESSDERMAGEGGGQQAVAGEKRDEAAWEGRPPLRRKKRADFMFPPPLPGLDWSGRSKTVLRAERGDGRLRLTEVKVGRPDTLHACREGGRLKLHLVPAGADAGDSTRVDDEEDIEDEGGAVMMGRLVPAVHWWHEESRVAAAGHLFVRSSRCLTTMT